MVNFLLLILMTLFVFRVPIHGNFAALAAGTFLYVICATGLGLLLSTFMTTQIAAIVGTAIATLLPAVQFAGILNPVSSLSGAGAAIGRLYPTTYFVSICRGAISKGLGFSELQIRSRRKPTSVNTPGTEASRWNCAGLAPRCPSIEVPNREGAMAVHGKCKVCSGTSDVKGSKAAANGFGAIEPESAWSHGFFPCPLRRLSFAGPPARVLRLPSPRFVPSR